MQPIPVVLNRLQHGIAGVGDLDIGKIEKAAGRHGYVARIAGDDLPAEPSVEAAVTASIKHWQKRRGPNALARKWMDKTAGGHAVHFRHDSGYTLYASVEYAPGQWSIMWFNHEGICRKSRNPQFDLVPRVGGCDWN